jgi:hypothetical protein
MSSDVRDFNNIETQAVIIFFSARQGAEGKQHSMEWRYSGSPCPPKNSEYKHPMEKFWPRFFGGIKTASSSLIIFQTAKISTRSITHLWWRLRTTTVAVKTR